MTGTDDNAFDGARISPDADPTPGEIREAAEAEAEAQAVDAEFGDAEFGSADETADGARTVARDHVTLGSVEPGSEGPEGTGVEGADDALAEDTTPRQEFGDEPSDSLGAMDEFTSEEVAAAEQGNRFGDEMVSEGDDDSEVAQLDGDDLDVDALADDGILPVDVVDGLAQRVDDLGEEE